MHSFMLKNKHVDSWLGTHQKLNRMAYRAMRRYVLLHQDELKANLMLSRFPDIKQVQHFEGINGPDGIKLKAPGQAEMPHFFQPYGDDDQPILSLLIEHENELKKALVKGNQERSAFEASWLAHALVDGLTPAHHYPYEEELEKLRGEGGGTRNTKTKKLLIKGENRRDTLRKSWRFLGAKGLLSTHMGFEGGVAGVVLPLRTTRIMPSSLEVEFAKRHGLIEAFRVAAQSVADMELYERYYQNGWTISIARDVRDQLIPPMVKLIAISWILSLQEK